MAASLDGTNGLTFNDGTLMGSAQFSNRLINPNFTVNQRVATGTVVLAAGAYGFDRWKAGASGCTFTFAVSANVTTLTISAGTLMQVIEGANLQSGVHVLSWTGSALGRIDAGSYSASGVTGTASGGTNQTIEFAAGTLVMPRYNQGAASSVQFLPVGLELALCQRYYVTSYIGVGVGSVSSAGQVYGGTYYNTSSVAGGKGVVQVNFLQMRAAPAVNIYSPSTGTLNQIFDNADRAASAIGISAKSFYGSYNGNGGFVAVMHYTANAEI